MTPETLVTTVLEARRFRKSAKSLQARLRADEWGTLDERAIAACRSALLDLDRALAILEENE